MVAAAELPAVEVMVACWAVVDTRIWGGTAATAAAAAEASTLGEMAGLPGAAVTVAPLVPAGALAESSLLGHRGIENEKSVD